MPTRLSTCACCGAGVAFGHSDNQGVMLEPAGYAATINSRTGEVFWQDTFIQHVCQPAAVRARQAYIKSITTEEERKRANDLAAQRELAKDIAKQFTCPKPRCEADVGEGCVNLTVLYRTGERYPTAWPHPERMELAMDMINRADAIGREDDDDAEEQQQAEEEGAPRGGHQEHAGPSDVGDAD